MSTFNDTKYQVPVIKLNQPDDSYKFRTAPAPSGKYPYRLKLKDHNTTDDTMLVFHMVGDTGGILNPAFQRKIATEMRDQHLHNTPRHANPQFLYHLGDVVYHHGEAKCYAQQFFNPYRDYPAPIFAIAGNHDSDVNPDAEIPYSSLDAFTTVFCDSERRKIDFSGDTAWQSMTQPNSYWTLETPLATIIGLHSNVPKYGKITEEQKRWFIEELQHADTLRPEKAIIVCIHHAPYSADVNHGSSLEMIAFLENAFTASAVRPDIIFSGHVHNYQRFTKHYSDGKDLPFIVAGGGGFDELHPLAMKSQENYTANHPLLENVILENYCDNCHGFLKVSLTRERKGIRLNSQYYTIGRDLNTNERASLTDNFSIMINGKV